jgi:transcription elongation factor GreA
VIDPATLNSGDRVVFGVRVDLYDLDDDVEVSYQIVGELEANLNQGQISVTSPIGRTLIGKQEGDEVEVQTPGGLKMYEIVKVRI